MSVTDSQRDARCQFYRHVHLLLLLSFVVVVVVAAVGCLFSFSFKFYFCTFLDANQNIKFTNQAHISQVLLRCLK